MNAARKLMQDITPFADRLVEARTANEVYRRCEGRRFLGSQTTRPLCIHGPRPRDDPTGLDDASEHGLPARRGLVGEDDHSNPIPAQDAASVLHRLTHGRLIKSRILWSA